MTDSPQAQPPGSYWVRPGQLLAGPYPAPWYSGGEQAREQLRALLEAGITFFLDLTEEREVAPYWPDLMGEAAAQGREVTHRRLAIPDMATPGRDEMVIILDALDAALDAGHTVYVHCLGGIGRTGTVIGCFLARHGLDGPTALDEIVRLRGGRTNSPQTDEQFRMVREWQELV
jgi:hypothetical protein